MKGISNPLVVVKIKHVAGCTVIPFDMLFLFLEELYRIIIGISWCIHLSLSPVIIYYIEIYNVVVFLNYSSGNTAKLTSEIHMYLIDVIITLKILSCYLISIFLMKPF